MAGIIPYGAYIPLWRLARDAIAEAWGSGSIRGERSVANNDEDALGISQTYGGPPQAAAVAVLGKELGYP